MLERQFSRSGGERSLYRACLLRGLRVKGPAVNPWPEDRVVDLVLRAPQQPASMTDADTADLVTVLSEFRAALEPMSAAASLFGMAENLTFGRAGRLTIPTVDDVPLATWVAEGAPIPVVMGLTPGVSMVPYKMGTIVALTNEMMLSSAAEAVMRAALISRIGPSLDFHLFTNAAGVPGLRPPGILNGVPITPASTAAGNEGMTQDMMTLAKALAPYGGNGNIAFIASADCWVRMTKTDTGAKGYPVFVASNLTTPTLIAVAAEALAVAMDTPTIDASSQAVMHMDDAPAPIVDDAGVMATPVRSMWQTDSVGLRFRLPVSWVLRAPAVAWLNPAWGAPAGP